MKDTDDWAAWTVIIMFTVIGVLGAFAIAGLISLFHKLLQALGFVS